MKTEFLVQLDGAGTDDAAQVIILGATNRPDELDDAARRRFVKRIYVPLPDQAARRQMIYTLLGAEGQPVGAVDAQGKRSAIYHQLSDADVDRLVVRTAGYSGADIRNLCTEAAMGPVREVSMRHGNNLGSITASEFPPIVFSPHIEEALDAVSATVTTADLRRYIEWNETFGTYRKLQIGLDE
jgi:fidgetin-like protein 1